MKYKKYLKWFLLSLIYPLYRLTRPLRNWLVGFLLLVKSWCCASKMQFLTSWINVWKIAIDWNTVVCIGKFLWLFVTVFHFSPLFPSFFFRLSSWCNPKSCSIRVFVLSRHDWSWTTTGISPQPQGTATEGLPTYSVIRIILLYPFSLETW